MRMNAIVAGVGMTRFGKHMETGLKALGAEAVEAALEDAGIESADLEAAYVSNAMAGIVTGQECIRGQVVLRSIGIGKIPVINIDNACGSGSTAFNQACAMVSTGCYDVALALGVEKLYHPDKQRTFLALRGGMDVEETESFLASIAADQPGVGEAPKASGGGDKRSVAMDFYANVARSHMREYGTTVEQLAGVSTFAGPLHIERVTIPPPDGDVWYTYTNVVFANGVVLVPTYPDRFPELDAEALAMYRRLLPDRRVVGIDVSDLIAMRGALRCISMNIAEGVLPAR